MNDPLRPGVTRTERVSIDRDRTIGFMGEECRVYATPQLVRDVEWACRELIRAHVEPGKDSVGMSLEIEHLAPTLLGMWAEITTTVTAVEGNSVTFEISARDALETIARGRHRRFLVNPERLAQRLKAKLDKARALETTPS